MTYYIIFSVVGGGVFFKVILLSKQSWFLCYLCFFRLDLFLNLRYVV